MNFQPASEIASAWSDAVPQLAQRHRHPAGPPGLTNSFVGSRLAGLGFSAKDLTNPSGGSRVHANLVLQREQSMAAQF